MSPYPQGVSTTHPGSQHLIILPDRGVAEQIVEDLRDEGFEHVRLEREAAPNQEHGEDDGEVEWAVHVLDTRLPDTVGGGAYEGLRARFIELAREHGGWYDEPGDPRPPRS